MMQVKVNIQTFGHKHASNIFKSEQGNQSEITQMLIADKILLQNCI